MLWVHTHTQNGNSIEFFFCLKNSWFYSKLLLVSGWWDVQLYRTTHTFEDFNSFITQKYEPNSAKPKSDFARWDGIFKVLFLEPCQETPIFWRSSEFSGYRYEFHYFIYTKTVVYFISSLIKSFWNTLISYNNFFMNFLPYTVENFLLNHKKKNRILTIFLT